MVVFSWQERWHIPKENERRQMAGLFMNMFILTSIADSVQIYNPDNDVSSLPEHERMMLLRSGEATPLGTTKTPDELDVILQTKIYPNTIEKMYDIRIPTIVEICLQLLSMLPPGWSMYGTNDSDVPYILSNDMGDFISPVEIYDEENDETEVLYATPQDKVIDGNIMNDVYDGLLQTNAESKEELQILYPSASEYIERAFKPGSSVLSIINEGKNTGIYDLAAIGDDVSLITSIMKIKTRFGANRILYA